MSVDRAWRRSASPAAGSVRAPLDGRGQELPLASINTLLAEIVRQCHARQIWLFGSRARGDAKPTSDWDLLVIVPDATDESLFDPRFAWRLGKDCGVYADIFLCRESDFDEDRNTVNTLLYEIAKDAVLIYER